MLMGLSRVLTPAPEAARRYSTPAQKYQYCGHYYIHSDDIVDIDNTADTVTVSDIIFGTSIKKILEQTPSPP